MDMTPERWDFTSGYLQDVFGREDDQLRTLMPRAVAAGLPEIAISADVGRLLHLLAKTTNQGRGPALVLELGTLAGYSAIWLARALAPGGRLITVEFEPKHADFAQAEFDRARLADRIAIRRGRALDVLPALARELGPNALDVAFIDAVKTEYLDYYRLIKPLLRTGGLFIADNALGSGSWWIDAAPGSSPERDTLDRFNRALAADPDFDAAAIPIRQGVLIARRK